MENKIYFRNYLTWLHEVDCIQASSKEAIDREIAYDFLKWIGDVQEVVIDGDGNGK